MKRDVQIPGRNPTLYLLKGIFYFDANLLAEKVRNLFQRLSLNSGYIFKTNRKV